MRSIYDRPPLPDWLRGGVSLRQSDPRWLRPPGPQYPPLPPLPEDFPRDDAPRPRPRLPTREARRHGGLVRASRMTAQERSIAAMRAARARWAATTPDDRRRVGEQLLRARRQRVQLIPASVQPRLAVWNPSMERKPCEVCGKADAAPYQRSLRQTHVWTWRCRRHANARRVEP